MISMLVYFIPSFLSLYIYDKVDRRSIRDLGLHYFLFVLLNNFMCFTVMTFYQKKKYILNLDASPISFVLKYFLLTIIFSIAIGAVYSFLSKKIAFNIEVKRGDSSEKKKNHK